MSKGVALKSFSLTNKILDISPQDEIYHFDAEANKKLNREAPWTKE
jgi:COP9 signalosome complex subunit 5